MSLSKIGMATGVVLLGVVAVPPMAASAEAPPVGESCARHPLPTLVQGANGAVDGSDPSGRYQFGWSADGKGDSRLVRWEDHVIQDLGESDGTQGLADDVNQSGEMVGTGLKDGVRQGWRWRNGTYSWLPAPGRDRVARAIAINAAGTVAGTAENRSDGWNQRAAVWSADGTVRELAIPDGFNEAKAVDIDEDGTVVGVVQDWDHEGAASDSARAVAWLPDGTLRILPGLGKDLYQDVVAIRNGTVIGSSSGSNGRAVVWRVREGEPAEVAPELDPSVQAVSGSGSIAFSTSNGTEIELLQNNVRRPLPLPDSSSPMRGGRTVGVTDGDIVYGYFSDDESGAFPFWWDCRPTAQ